MRVPWKGVLAALSLAIFVAGTIAVPMLHLAFHELPHEHAGWEIDYAAHTHGGDAHPHEHEHPHEPPPEPESGPDHGDGSAAHFALAISDSAAASFTLPFYAFLAAEHPHAAADHPAEAAHVAVARFRGPPALLS